MRNYVLSKSTYIRGIQCEKSLYLNKYSPENRTKHNFIKRKVFDFGRDFESKFKSNLEFSKGIDLKEKFGNNIDKYAD